VNIYLAFTGNGSTNCESKELAKYSSTKSGQTTAYNDYCENC